MAGLNKSAKHNYFYIRYFMKYSIFAITLFFAISCTASQPPRPNPCKAWDDMIEQAKKENGLSPVKAAFINDQVKKAGCTQIKGKEKAGFEKLYKIAGAIVECADETRVIPGAGPFTRKMCSYTIDFRTLNSEIQKD